jgi:hypothetical protein
MAANKIAVQIMSGAFRNLPASYDFISGVPIPSEIATFKSVYHSQ